MQKKTIALLLAVLMCLTLFAGCADTGSPAATSAATSAPAASSAAATSAASSAPDAAGDLNFNPTGYPIVNEPVTLSVMNALSATGGPWGDAMSWFRAKRELTGIDFTFSDIAEGDWDTKMNLSLAAGDLPDIYMSGVGATNIVNYGVKGGVFYNFADKIETYMPHMLSWLDKYPELIKIVTEIDGGVYTFPKVSLTATVGQGNMYVRLDHMKAAGIEKEPETLDEFTAMLYAIQDANKSNSDFYTFLPYSVAHLNGQFEPFIMAAMGDYTTSSFHDDGTGKVFYNGTSEQYFRYLEYANRLFADKVMANEIYTMDTATTLAETKANKVAVMTYGTMLNQENFESGELELTLLGPLTSEYSPEKKIVSYNPLLYTGIVITNKCEYPEAMLRWFDIDYAKEDVAPGLNSISGFLGLRGENWDYTDDTKEYYEIKMPADWTRSATEFNYTHGAPSALYALDFMAIASGSNVGLELKGRHSVEKVYPYVVPNFPLAFLKYEDAEFEEYTALWTDINSYITQMKAKFISGAEPLSKYEEYVSTLDKMGLPRVVEIIQSAYDRFNG